MRSVLVLLIGGCAVRGETAENREKKTSVVSNWALLWKWERRPKEAKFSENPVFLFFWFTGLRELMVLNFSFLFFGRTSCCQASETSGDKSSSSV